MNIADLYSTRIQKSYDEDQAEILSILKSSTRKVLKLINYYKGLPLSYPGTVVSVDRNAVHLEVTPEQAFAIEKCRSVFIRSPLFNHDVFAQSQYVNAKKKAATFVKFSYVEIMAERRNFIRMTTDRSPEATIESPLGLLEGSLYDISLSGINITLDHFCPLEADTEASTRFVLRNEENDLNFDVRIPARLIGMPGDVNPNNCRFSIAPDRTIERQLSKYLIQRQIEIIKEIKDAVL